MICEFCSGDGSMYESSEYPDDLYTLEEILPMQGNEVVCPVCEGSGEIFVPVGEDDATYTG